LTLTCQPEVQVGQKVSLLIGGREVFPQAWTAASNTFTFVIEQAPAGDHLTRFRVDGIESPLIDRMAVPPVFFNHRITIT
jgi:hypothetical protein